MSVLLSFLFVVQAVAGAETADPATCIAFHCALEGAACVVNAECLATLQVRSPVSSIMLSDSCPVHDWL